MVHDPVQSRIVAALRDARRYPHPAGRVQVIETHISWIVLAGQYAYKIKKALDLEFLDYSTLQSRQACCEEELRLNRRTAPDLYLDVVTIGGTPDNPQFGALPALEYAVRMRRFSSTALLDHLLQGGKLTPQHIDSLAAAIAAFHTKAAVAQPGSPFGTADAVRAAALQNFEQLLALLPGEPDRKNISVLRSETEAEFLACRTTFEARRRRGFVRECHGDLHLGNIALIDGQPVPFDCIEFNPALRWIDVMDESAFTMMDLLYRGHADLAWRFLNALLEISGDYGAAGVLRFYLAYRAAVRAKVCAIRAAQSDIAHRDRTQQLDECRQHLGLARRCLQRGRPGLVITCGLPGSGKTTFSQYALQQLGAIRIRSDIERKRLFGMTALQSSGGAIYSAVATQRTYERLLELARELLAEGYNVIVDAAFLQRGEREQFRALASEVGAPFAIAALHADVTTLKARIRSRRNDASEADLGVLEKLQALQQPLVPEEIVWSCMFTTAEAPDSRANAQNWRRLMHLLAPCVQGI